MRLVRRLVFCPYMTTVDIMYASDQLSSTTGHSRAPFTRVRLQKSINALLGIIEGVAIDGVIKKAEMTYLHGWIRDHEEVRDRHPYTELMPILGAALNEGILTKEERADITWLCERLTSDEHRNYISADLQRLRAILNGILADREISEAELQGLSEWLNDHTHLATCWPYDEVGSLVTCTLADKRMDATRHAAMLHLFAEYANGDSVDPELTPRSQPLSGLCAMCPEIQFRGRTFCFTGSSARLQPTDFAELVMRLGGTVTSSPSPVLNYLVVGAEGAAHWEYACYGRKIDEVARLRRDGARTLIIHELDFLDAARDAAS